MNCPIVFRGLNGASGNIILIILKYIIINILYKKLITIIGAVGA